MAKYTFKEFQAEYPDDEACLAKIMEIQYGGSQTNCPVCKERRQFHLMSKRRAYACQVCGHHIYPCAGTIFHKSRTNLTKWFFAMYLMTSTRHGVAAKEIERQLGVTYKTAWRMCHELRKLMAAADYQGPLGGSGKHVEIDETLIGGRSQVRGFGSRLYKKTMVMGMIERDGKMRAGPVSDDRIDTLEPIVIAHVDPQTTVSTDGLPSYNALGDTFAEHGVVKHHLKEYVRGKHHTNTIEGHWSLLKRSIRGTHVHISQKHAWKYIAEFSYRHNMRKSHSAMFSLLVHAFALPRLADA
jgi:ISXO2 transposase-like protein/transposase-like zinc ribbon protein